MNQPKTGSSNEFDQTTPRLFRLRDLHPAKTAAAQSDTANDSVPDNAPHDQTLQDQATAAGMSPPISNPVTQPMVSGQHAVVDEFVKSSIGSSAGESTEDLATGDLAEEQRTRERLERHLDVSPEGRSWMESALAHRKVLTLLAIAISAAFWTSRGDHDLTDTDSDLARSDRTLDFDPSQFDTGTIVDGTNDYFPSETSNNLTSENLIAGNANSSATGSNAYPVDARTSDAQTSDVQTSDASRLASDALAPNRNGDLAALEASGSGPQTRQQPYASLGAVAHGDGFAESNSNAAQDQLAKIEIETSGLKVQAVSSKTPRDPVFGTPSFEDLERAAMELDPSQMSTEVGLTNSTTPNGVTDWLKYLPPQP